MRRILSTSLLLLLFSIVTTAAYADTSTTANNTIAATSCSQSDVQTALNAVTSSTTLVTIPGGTCSWTSPISWTLPSGNTNLTIQGQTAINFTGTAGQSSYACTINDGQNATCPSSGSGGTVITDGTGAGNNLFDITLSGGSSCKFTLANLTFVAGTSKNDGIVVTNGPCNNLRWTQVHIVTNASQSGSRFFGQLEGVIDHSVCDLNGNTTSNCFIMSNTIGDSIGYGDGTWANATDFGQSDFMFMENDIVNGGLFQDCDTAGRFVVRYSSVLNGSSVSANIHTHGTKTGSGRIRSCRAYEAYKNYINCTGCSNSAAVSSGGGPSLVWGNTLAGGYNSFAGVEVPRNDTESDSPTPGSWGYCGTNVNGNGVGSKWDGNSGGGGSPTASGYPCLDGIGRGQGTQALNGQSFPNDLNSTTGTIAFPQEYLEPAYYFDNSLGGTNELFIGDQPGNTALNRDVYIDNASFTGASGTGSGPLASRPSTCTAGPGGTYGQSPTGSYGVAYFATDANNGNGELYVCTAANTWTAIYQAYAYPHPLVSGLKTSTVSPPSNLSGTFVQ